MALLQGVKGPVDETVLDELRFNRLLVDGTEADDSDLCGGISFFGEHVGEKSW